MGMMTSVLPLQTAKDGLQNGHTSHTGADVKGRLDSKERSLPDYDRMQTQRQDLQEIQQQANKRGVQKTQEQAREMAEQMKARQKPFNLGGQQDILSTRFRAQGLDPAGRSFGMDHLEQLGLI